MTYINHKLLARILNSRPKDADWISPGAITTIPNKKKCMSCRRTRQSSKFRILWSPCGTKPRLSLKCIDCLRKG